MDDLSQLTDGERDELDALLFDYAAFQKAYRYDPVGFVFDCFDWSRMKDRPTNYQIQIMERLVQHTRVAVRGPHGLGKTALASWIVLWFGLTREGLDWKTITTAGSWHQLTRFMWPEVHKWSRLLRWELIGRGPLIEGAELQVRALKLETGEASAAASNQPSLIEGAHADHILYIFDESKAIPNATFDAAEGAFSGSGGDTGREALALSISTPGPTEGRFYDIHRKKRGLEDWWTRHVTVTEVIDAGRVSKEWVERRGRQWGTTSAVYQNRVLGEFASSSEDSVIPLAWVEAANERWLAWRDEQMALAHKTVIGTPKPRAKLTAIGADIAYGGKDLTIVAERLGPVIERISMVSVERVQVATDNVDKDPGMVAGRAIAQIVSLRGGVPVVDVVGYGASAVTQLRAMKVLTIAFNAGAAARLGEVVLKDKSGELTFADLRSACHWYLRECLSPEAEAPIMIPPDDAIDGLPEDASLVGDLTAATWEARGKGVIKVESKDDIRVRIGRSTDVGDAVIQAFAYDLLKYHVAGMPIELGKSGSTWRI